MSGFIATFAIQNKTNNIMKHTNIDWEYKAECLACEFLSKRYNDFNYCELKDICEDEIMYYMEHEDDTMPMVERRIRYRIKNHLLFFHGDNAFRFHHDFEWLEDWYNNKYDRKTYSQLMFGR